MMAVLRSPIAVFAIIRETAVGCLKIRCASFSIVLLSRQLGLRSFFISITGATRFLHVRFMAPARNYKFGVRGCYVCGCYVL